MNSSPRSHQDSSAIRFACVPEDTKTAASFPNSFIASCSRRVTVGSSPQTSSPTSARNMARRIAKDGRVTVSLRKSDGFDERKKRDRPLPLPFPSGSSSSSGTHSSAPSPAPALARRLGGAPHRRRPRTPAPPPPARHGRCSPAALERRPRTTQRTTRSVAPPSAPRSRRARDMREKRSPLRRNARRPRVQGAAGPAAREEWNLTRGAERAEEDRGSGDRGPGKAAVGGPRRPEATMPKWY